MTFVHKAMTARRDPQFGVADHLGERSHSMLVLRPI